MAIPQTTPQEAQKLLQTGYRYIDVRTEAEFANGHPSSAVNIPVAVPDATTHQMVLNPDFVKVVEAHFPKEQPIVLGCQSGGRSQHAAQMMAAVGYTQVVNMQGGWGVWLDCGLPVCGQCAAGATYGELHAKLG